MKTFIIFILLLFSAFPAFAQNATNVRVYQDGEYIIITYELDKRAAVRVLVATGQSNRYTELKAVTGSVGKDVSAGVNKQIIWQPLQEQTEFVAQNVRFKVEVKPVQYYFSVSKNKKIVFSPGNLQYTRSTATWSFAENQYDMLGVSNVSGGTESYDATLGYSKSGSAQADKIDLFGWSGSIGTAKWGISTSISYFDYPGNFMDWGKNIGDGITYRTLTNDEWKHLIYTRTNASERKGVARIKLSDMEYVNGLIFLPDNWTCPEGITFKSGSASSCGVQAYADYQTFTLVEWQQLESAGAVFLPASGYCYGSNTCNVQYGGRYWSATANDSRYAYYLYFSSYQAYTDDDLYRGRRAVRLVQELD